jgi:hypothetical protein
MPRTRGVRFSDSQSRHCDIRRTQKHHNFNIIPAERVNFCGGYRSVVDNRRRGRDCDIFEIKSIQYQIPFSGWYVKNPAATRLPVLD